MSYFLPHIISVYSSDCLCFFFIDVKVADIVELFKLFGIHTVNYSLFPWGKIYSEVNKCTFHLSFNAQLCDKTHSKLGSINITPENVCTQSVPAPLPSLLPVRICFHHRLVRPILELHINGVTQYVSCVTFHSACFEIHHFVSALPFHCWVVLHCMSISQFNLSLGWTTDGQWAVYSFWLLWIKLLWTFLCKPFCGSMFSFW